MFRRDRVVLALVLFLLLPSISRAATRVVLTNGTRYDWRSSDVRSVQMTEWNFPAVIKAQTEATAYVEPGEGFPSGEVTYSLEGTDYKFKVSGRATTTTFDLRVVLTNLALPGYPKGSAINLGFLPDGVINFNLSGKPGVFTSNFSGSAWMHNNLDVLGRRSLRHLCIPGAHDAGMSLVTSGTALASYCNTVTQYRTVLGQLEYGVRYFDIRPVISHGQFYTGHYSQGPAPLGWQGTNGQSLDSIIADVNAYTAKNQELIVLHLTHDLNTDVGRSYRPFTQNEWDRLLFELRRLNHRFEARDPANVDLTTLRLDDFIGSEAAVVIVAKPDGPNITMGSLRTEGVYTLRNFPIFNEYSATSELRPMMSDQLTKLQAQRPNPDAGYFLLSWTLTQTPEQAALCTFGVADAIVTMGDRANRYLNGSLMDVEVCNRWTYPNVLYIDSVRSSEITSVAMAVNGIASRSTPQEYVVYKGSGTDAGIYVAYTPDSNLSIGGAWRLIRLNGAINTSDTPGTVSFGGRLYVLYKGSGSDSRIFVAQPRSVKDLLNGKAWSTNPLNGAINTGSAPGIAVLNDTPYMLYKGAGIDTNVYIARSAGNRIGDGNSWSAKRLNPAINTNHAPAVAAFGGVLYLFYKGSGDDNIWIARSSGDVFDGNAWTANRLNPGINTSTAPGVVVYGGYLYVFYKGSGGDTNIYIARAAGRDLFDGASWEYTRLNPGINTTVAPKPMLVGDSLYLFYKGSGDNNIWIADPRSPDLFDGNAWHWERLNPAINTSTGPGAVTW